MRYFEDLEPGRPIELGSVTVTEEMIVEFGTRYDPQLFHTDPVRAREHPLFGGLVASGWHTLALYIRLLVDGFMHDVANLGGGSVDELRWLRPVRPGDTLSGRYTVINVRPSRSRPDRGIVISRAEMHNQDGELVMHFTGTSFALRRPSGREGRPASEVMKD